MSEQYKNNALIGFAPSIPTSVIFLPDRNKTLSGFLFHII